MSRHVEHLLAAYGDGLLTASEAAQVTEHLSRCQACHDRLAEYQRISNDLRLSLAGRPRASRAEVRRWWRTIAAARVQEPRPNRLLVIAPALLVALLLSLPLLTTLNLSAHPANTSQVVDTTRSSEQVSFQPVAGVIPQPEQTNQTITMVATAAPQENSATAAPAPLAPSIQ